MCDSLLRAGFRRIHSETSDVKECDDDNKGVDCRPSVGYVLPTSVSTDWEVTDNSEFLHLQPMIDSLPASLSADERARAVQLLRNNADIFSRHEFDFGTTNLLLHCIHTGDHPPVTQPLRRHPHVYRQLIDDTVEGLRKAGVAEEASSPWSFNIVLVAKTDNPVPRITVDYRALNEITYKNKWPIPRCGDCLEALSGSIFLSVMNMSGSFYQVELDPRDSDNTAFLTRRGQFRFCEMPMGACNSPSVFARLMTMALKGLQYVCCLCYIDDTILLKKTFEDHCQNLQLVFDRFRKANLKLKSEKCKMLQLKVKFLGHIVSQHGIEVNPEKTAAIEAWEFPKNVTEVREFLGLAGYYRQFVQNYAMIAQPLQDMTKKGATMGPTRERS